MGKVPVLLIAIVLAATACSSGGNEQVSTDASTTSTEAVTATSTTEPETSTAASSTDEETPGDLLDPAFLTTTAKKARVSDGTFMIAVVDSDGAAIEGSTGTDAIGNSPTAGDAFRVGSITKVFTSLATLSLVDEGLVDLDAVATDYVTRVPVPEEVTVRDLLSHQTGIFNYTDVPGFFGDLFAETSREWTPEETVGLIADREPQFTSGSQFEYSNTNYAILGILIEEVTGQSYHEVVRQRILDPLVLSSTYLAGFEEGPDPFDPFVQSGNDEYDYTSIATAAWSAGAMVSSAEDLHALFTGLFDDRIVSQEMLAQMTVDHFYGLGVELDGWQSGLIGHSGDIPGYRTFVRHSTESGITAFLVATDDQTDPGFAIEAVLDAMVPESDAVVAGDPPRNDLFVDSVVIDPEELPFTDSVNTTGATTDDDDLAVACPASAIDASVWYTITPTTDSAVVVSADGTDYSYGISVATGTAGSFDLIECRPFAFTIDAVAGETYHLQIFDDQGDRTGNGGNLKLTLEEAPASAN